MFNFSLFQMMAQTYFHFACLYLILFYAACLRQSSKGPLVILGLLARLACQFKLTANTEWGCFKCPDVRSDGQPRSSMITESGRRPSSVTS